MRAFFLVRAKFGLPFFFEVGRTSPDFELLPHFLGLDNLELVQIFLPKAAIWWEVATILDLRNSRGVGTRCYLGCQEGNNQV